MVRYANRLLFELYSDKTPTKVRGWIKSVTGWCELVLSWQYLEGSLMENTLQQNLPRCPVRVWPFGSSLHSSQELPAVIREHAWQYDEEEGKPMCGP